MERFLFIVDERLPLELVAEVLRLRDDVYEIYRRPVEFANLLTKLPVKGSDFTKKGEIIRTTEYGVQRNAKQILKAAEELLGVNNQHIVFITVDVKTAAAFGHARFAVAGEDAVHLHSHQKADGSLSVHSILINDTHIDIFITMPVRVIIGNIVYRNYMIALTMSRLYNRYDIP